MAINNSLIYNGVIFKTGDQVTCNINGFDVKDAQIYIVSDEEMWNDINAFICQNYKNGWHSPDNLGYRFSWAIKIREGTMLIEYSVSDLKKVISHCFDNIVEMSFPNKG
jgi:hypothetical protein